MSPVKVGAGDVADVRVGAAAASAVYVGATKVWPSGGTPPSHLLQGRWSWVGANNTPDHGEYANRSSGGAGLVIAGTDFDGQVLWTSSADLIVIPSGSTVDVSGAHSYSLTTTADSYWQTTGAAALNRVPISTTDRDAIAALLTSSTVYTVTVT